MTEKPKDDIFMIYEGSEEITNKNVWFAYQFNKLENLTYNMLVDTFLTDYRLRKPAKKIIMKDIKLSLLTLDDNIPVKNLANKVDPQQRNILITFDSSTIDSIDDLYKPYELDPNTRKSFFEFSNKFFKDKKFISSFRFSRLIQTYGAIQQTKLYYKLKKWEFFKKNVDQALLNFPNDYSLLKMSTDFFERTDNISKSLSLYKNNSFQYPIFKVAYYRSLLSRENQPQVETIVNETLGHLHSQKFDMDLLFECARIYIKNNEFEKAVNLCFLNQEFLLKSVTYFCSVPTLPKTFRKVLITKNLSPQFVSIIAFKMFEYNEISNSLKLLESLFKNNKNSIYIALSYMFLLFKSYNYDNLIDTIVEFFTVMPKYVGKYPCHIFFAFLQTSSAFRSRIFSPQNNPDADLSDYDYSEMMDNTPLDESIQWTTEENYYFQLMLMLIVVFHVVIGDKQWFKSFYNRIGSSIVVDKKSAPMFHYIEELYQSSVYVQSSMQPLAPTDNSFLAIGDVHAISTCNIRVTIANQQFRITSLPIENLSIYDLISTKKNANKEMFYKFLVKAEQFRILMLVIGTYDCEKIIPKMASKNIDSKQPATDAISDLVNYYMILLTETRRKLPRFIPIIVHGAIPRFNWSIPIVERFNGELKNMLKRDFLFISPFQSQSTDGYFTTFGLKDNLPDARYPLTISSIMKKIDL